MKLIYKILFGYFLVVSILGIFSTSILIYDIEKHSKELDTYREREITSLAEIIDAVIHDKNHLQDLTTIQKLFTSSTVKLPHIKRLTLHAIDPVTQQYTHIASSILDIIGTPSHKEDIAAIRSNKTTILYEDAPDGDRYLDITYPILNEKNEPIAALGIAASLKESDEILSKALDEMRKDAIDTVLIAIGFSLVLALVLIFIISKKVVSPLEKLKKAAQSISKNNLKKEIEVTSNDEIGELAQEFNNMAQELNAMYESLEDKITEKTQELESQFLTDSLTGLQNRYALFKNIEELPMFHVAILDISSFKDINDVYGINLGNQVLKDVSKRYLDYLSDSGLNLYRLSGDETLVLNPDIMTEDKFLETIKHIISKIEHEVFYYRESDVEINLSIHAGISLSSENALEKANIALIQAKYLKRDFCIFTDKQYEENSQGKDIQTISKIKYALKNFGILVYYQAIVDAKYNTIKYEALVRMIDDDKIISPFFFLDISKKTKHYKEISKIVIHSALQEFKNRDEQISINICAEDINSIETQKFILKELKEFKDPSKVVIELVETEDMHTIKEITSFISSIKDIGAKIAIDDFGTGYSNFAYLLDLEPHYLKIDGSLIKNIDTDVRSYNIVKTIVNFAHGLNIKVIAEFIHSKEVLEVCEKLDIDEFQGYYFDEPSELS